MSTWFEVILFTAVVLVILGHMIDAAVNPLIKEIRKHGEQTQFELEDIRKEMEKHRPY